jgi:hypothetical protein
MVYDSSDSNCRSVGLVMGYGNNLFGVFEVQKESSSEGYISRNETNGAPNAFGSAIFKSYGYGSNQYVSVLVKINPNNGQLEYGTFLMSKFAKGSSSG